jgi:hypothetical protein
MSCGKWSRMNTWKPESAAIGGRFATVVALVSLAP